MGALQKFLSPNLRSGRMTGNGVRNESRLAWLPELVEYKKPSPYLQLVVSGFASTCSATSMIGCQCTPKHSFVASTLGGLMDGSVEGSL